MSTTTAPETASRPAPSRIAWICAGVLALTLVVLLAGDLLSLRRQHPAASTAALVAARTEAVNFFTLDYRHIDADIAAVLQLATGTFKTEYAHKQTTVRQGIVSGRLSSTATIDDASTAVEMQTRSQVIVLAAVDATTTAAGTAGSAAKSQTDRYRMRLTVDNVHGRWLVSSIEQVG